MQVPTDKMPTFENENLNFRGSVGGGVSMDPLTLGRLQKSQGVDFNRFSNDGRVIPQNYNDMLRKSGQAGLTGNGHLAFLESLIEENCSRAGIPNPFGSYDVTQYGAPQSMRKSFFNNFSAQMFGNENSSYANDLSKALSTANLGGSFGDATPLRLQNLDATMTSVLYKEQHFAMFNWLERIPSIQPYFEWNDRLSYGDDRSSGAFTEGGVPAGGISQYSRNGIYVRYFGRRRGITHQMALTGQLGGSMIDPVAEENRNGAMSLLSACERNFIFGDHTITDNDSNIVNYDGIISALENGVQYVGTAQTNAMPSNYTAGQNIIDLQGKYLDFSNIEDACQNLAEYGFITDFNDVRSFMSPSVLSDLSKLKFAADRRVIPEGAPGQYTMGTPLAGHMSNYGFIPFTYDLFLKRAGITDQPPAAAGVSSPTKPTISVAAGAPGGGVSSSFVASNGQGSTDADTYYYWVTAGNDSGESIASTVASVAVAVGQVATLTITPGASNGNTQTYFRIYRGITNSSTALTSGCIGMVSANGASAVSFVDTNAWRQKQGMFLIIDRKPENIGIAQMAPMMKWPLAITTTTVEWLVLLYHVLVVKAPQRMYLIKNVGPLSL